MFTWKNSITSFRKLKWRWHLRWESRANIWVKGVLPEGTSRRNTLSLIQLWSFLFYPYNSLPLNLDPIGDRFILLFHELIANFWHYLYCIFLIVYLCSATGYKLQKISFIGGYMHTSRWVLSTLAIKYLLIQCVKNE